METHLPGKQELKDFYLRHRSLPEWMRARMSDTQRYFLFWILAGILCGLTAVAFHLAIDVVWKKVLWFAESYGGGGAGTYALLLAAPVLGGLLTGILMQTVAPEAVGSGIPLTKVRYHRDFGMFTLREAVGRFVVGVLSTGSGMSLGREGPTVHICAAIASKVGQVFGLARRRVQAMVPVGMAAGISAAFNTPMAAMFFVYEELLGDFSTKSLFGILVAVVLASIVERSILGEHPVFALSLPAFHTDWWMLVCLPLGLLAAVSGHLFVRSVLHLRERVRQVRGLPLWLRPALGGLVVGISGVAVLYFTGLAGVFGIGYADLSATLNGQQTTLWILVALFIGKALATIAAYACGASGGLFAPALFLGGMLGGIVGVLGSMVLPWSADIVGAVALLGMGAFFAAVIRCPMTSFMIIFEMTRNYTLMLPLMIGNGLAYILAARWQPVALYDSLLLQDKISLKKMPSYSGEKDWRNLPLQTIMTFDIVSVLAADTPEAAVKKLDGHRHHAYPVLDGEGLVKRMITHHELEDLSREGFRKPLAELPVRRRLVTLSPNASIREAAKTLVLEDVMQAPVVSPTRPGKLLGILTLHDIARQQNAIDGTLERD
jgi:chloride channel protein, CIC family